MQLVVCLLLALEMSCSTVCDYVALLDPMTIGDHATFEKVDALGDRRPRRVRQRRSGAQGWRADRRNPRTLR